MRRISNIPASQVVGRAVAFAPWVFAFACVALPNARTVTPAVESDWLKAAEVADAPRVTVRPQTDAAGGCDGVKDGKWGFHTGHEQRPWWVVDLGKTQAIARIVIWNRCDGASERAAHLWVTFSDDGKTWRPVYKHDGTSFGGVADNKPLQIRLTNEVTRYVCVQLPGTDFLHLDEVEVFGVAQPDRNLALRRPANQSSVSQWSVSHAQKQEPDWNDLTKRTLAQFDAVKQEQSTSNQELFGQRHLSRLTPPVEERRPGQDRSKLTRADYLSARAQLREAMLADPLLDFSDLLFVKRMPGTFSHMSDQYYGWWSRPGGGLFVLKNWKSADAKLVHLTPSFAPGSFLKPELSYDAKHVLFSYCAFHPGVRENRDKTRKEDLPEDAFYHVFEMNIDGSSVRQLTHGHYDDFNARYLPNGEIVFLSTRRGTFLQTGRCAATTTRETALPDSYVRCGGDTWRPVAVYTLHVTDRGGENLRAISPFENFEWDPVVANDGRIVYARWDYVDRDNMPYMSLWSTNPDGTNPQLVYKNHTRSPYGVFEARPVPNSRKFIFTASAHHSISGGSLCLLDPEQGNEDMTPLTRLTPEVPFPEIEGWSQTWYGTPYPLSEKLFLTSWSAVPMFREGQAANPTDALGLYLYHATGARELIYRDPNISSSDAMPVRARKVPPVISSSVAWDAPQQGKFLLLDVYQGLTGVARGSVKALRVVGVPAKVQPQMNTPKIGITADDPGKFILGTVPVEADGSAHFHVPSGVNVFFQALDTRGIAIQTMRTVSYVQAGQTLSCVGCHEHRGTAPINLTTLAAQRAPSKLQPGPDGTWPFRFDRLVLPVVEAKCVSCHQPGATEQAAAKFDLRSARAYETLIGYGKPSFRDTVRKQYFEGRSIPNKGLAQTSALLAYLQRDAVHKPLLNEADFSRLTTWLDVYGQRIGAFSDDQERQLATLRTQLGEILDERPHK